MKVRRTATGFLEFLEFQLSVAGLRWRSTRNRSWERGEVPLLPHPAPFEPSLSHRGLGTCPKLSAAQAQEAFMELC